MSKFTFFWNNRTPFSNWYPSVFTVDGTTFTRGEQYMMYMKAVVFGDMSTADLIMLTDDPQTQKNLGRQVRNYDDAVWSKVRFGIMVDGLYCKFSQNPKLKEALLATVGTRMVEASPFDRIWGIGLTASDPLAQNEETWLGLNLMGKVLDELRDMLVCNK